MSDKNKINSEIREFGHDVLNSLTRVIGQIEVSLRSDDLEVIKNKLAITLQAANDCASFVKVNMSGSGQVKEQFALVPFFKELQETYKKMFPDFPLLIQTAKAGEVEINANKTLLKNAIQNLTKNSMEAGAKKMVVILDDSKISFIDNGPGISKDKESDIKEKGTTKEDAALHGLGLKSLHRFCQMNEWRFEAHNNLNTQYFATGFTVEFIFNNK